MSISLPTNDVKVEFLNLLVVQLQHQDPLEPVKQEQFISQLTEISTGRNWYSAIPPSRSMLPNEKIANTTAS